jgi:hypothetical protein
MRRRPVNADPRSSTVIYRLQHSHAASLQLDVSSFVQETIAPLMLVGSKLLKCHLSFRCLFVLPLTSPRIASQSPATAPLHRCFYLLPIYPYVSSIGRGVDPTAICHLFYNTAFFVGPQPITFVDKSATQCRRIDIRYEVGE